MKTVFASRYAFVTYASFCLSSVSRCDVTSSFAVVQMSVSSVSLVGRVLTGPYYYWRWHDWLKFEWWISCWWTAGVVWMCQWLLHVGGRQLYASLDVVCWVGCYIWRLTGTTIDVIAVVMLKSSSSYSSQRVVSDSCLMVSLPVLISN
jgi:hypothetical protein